ASVQPPGHTRRARLERSDAHATDRRLGFRRAGASLHQCRLHRRPPAGPLRTQRGRKRAARGECLGAPLRAGTARTAGHAANRNRTVRGATMITQTPIYRAVQHVAQHDDDVLVRDAASRVLSHVPDFTGLPEADTVALYDVVNGEGAFDFRCEMAAGGLTRQDIIDRAAVDLAYAYVRELQRRAAGNFGLDVMAALAYRINLFLSSDNERRSRWN